MLTWLIFFWDGLGGATQTPTQPVIAARFPARPNAAICPPRCNATQLPARPNAVQFDSRDA